ncbi:hypothetical protein MJH12_10500 [bacterium]|nr:hypothetical protein [bacterium]
MPLPIGKDTVHKIKIEFLTNQSKSFKLRLVDEDFDNLDKLGAAQM